MTAEADVMGRAIVISLEQAVEIEKCSCLQASSDIWHKQRQLRITSTKFKQICSRTMPVTVEFVDRLIDGTQIQTYPMKQGIQLEEAAAKQCFQKLQHCFNCAG